LKDSGSTHELADNAEGHALDSPAVYSGLHMLFQQTSQSAFRTLPSAGWLWVWCALLCGCEQERMEFTEVKRVHEPVTAAEFASVMRIVNELPDQRFPAIPPVFLPPPQWNEGRTLTVGGLYEEELRLREDGWNSARLALVFERDKILMRELRKEFLTPEQFAGLMLTLGAAMCRNEVPDGVDLAALSERARSILEELARDLTPFSTLSREAQFSVLQKAMWLPRKLRADKLKQVPLENQELARKHHDWLIKALPEEFHSNPMDEIRDLLEERGMPFEELPDSGSDEDIPWQQPAQVGPRN